MDDVLLGIVLERLAARPLPPREEDILIAALDSDQALDAQLNVPEEKRYPRDSENIVQKEPAGAYLRSVSVTGFRGIGPKATLNVAPGPGLTLVVGRNGSGKSSFAEALEVLLTGTLMRWDGAPAVVRSGWQSKHHNAGNEIQAEFFIEGSGPVTVSRAWAQGADLQSSSAWLQRAREKRTSLSELGWDADLKEYRPFLSHAELEAFFGRPCDLYDLLASVLGLDDLIHADRRLRLKEKERDGALKDIKQRLEVLRQQLQPLADGDERARSCLSAVTGNVPAKWDIKAAEAVATGRSASDSGQSEFAALRSLAQVSAPPQAEVNAAVAALRNASEGLRKVAGTSAAHARDLVSLLDMALGHHALHGDGDCPVCGNRGVLTPQWRTAVQQQRDRLQAQATAANQAASAAKDDTHRALKLIAPAPRLLVTPNEPSFPSVDIAPAVVAWRQWSAPISGDERVTPESLNSPEAMDRLAEHMEAAFPALAEAVASLNGAAAREVTRRDGAWSPVAKEVADWCRDAETARAEHEMVPALKQARKWLTEANSDLRDERLEPLADKSRAIWAQLRQESSVDLGAFHLAGINTQRRVDLEVSIDGAPGAALGVMSQGEINALALSVFLPRATMSGSPFNFLVIDDPVQAMDPAKVDGLARVLDSVAKERQVIVFTHDNRLPAAIKDLSISATIVEVTRQPRSRVSVRECLNASKQALKDANAVNKDPDVPVGIKKRVIPGLCRMAVEAAFTEAFWRRQLRAGKNRAQIEAVTEGKVLKTMNTASLAIFGNTQDAGRATQEVERRWGRPSAQLLRTLNGGAHDAYHGDIDLLIEDSRGLVSKIDEDLK